MISSSDIISRSFTVYKENFVDYLKYIALNFLPALVSFTIFSIFGVTAAISMGANNLNGVASLSLGIFLVVASAILIAGLAFWINIAFMRMIGLKDRGKDTEGVLNNFMAVRPRFWRAIGTSIVVGLYAGWPMIVTMTLYSLLTLGGVTNSTISLLFGLLGIAAVFYAFYYSIRLIFSVFHVILDDGGIMESINFSMEQVDGRWLDIFWRLIAPAVVFFLVVFISQLILTGILAVADVAVISGTVALLLFLIQVLVPPLYPTAQLVLYNNVAGKGDSAAETKTEEGMESEAEERQTKEGETQLSDKESELNEDQNEEDFTETADQEESES